MPLTDRVNASVEQRLQRLQQDFSQVCAHYPRRRVTAALAYWRAKIDCRSYNQVLAMVHASELPDPADPEQVFAFAMTFNGYDHYGSLKASAEAARERRRQNLDDLRNELFFSARALRHGGGDKYLRVYADLLPRFRQHALNGSS